MGRTIRLLALAASLLAASPAWATTYTVDKQHSTVGFKIRHLFSNVLGTFDDFEGEFTYVPGQPEQWTATATAKAASINTKVEGRDKHLRSADFFDVEKFPTLTFRSTQVTDASERGAKLHGMLSIHGVEKPVVLDLAIHGEGKDPWGNARSGFTATTRINRKDFGLNWNQALETGGVLVGEEVDIILEIEGIVKQ
jgi:polyisoprenoid-binding protein YceI